MTGGLVVSWTPRRSVKCDRRGALEGGELYTYMFFFSLLKTSMLTTKDFKQDVRVNMTQNFLNS